MWPFRRHRPAATHGRDAHKPFGRAHQRNDSIVMIIGASRARAQRARRQWQRNELSSQRASVSPTHTHIPSSSSSSSSFSAAAAPRSADLPPLFIPSRDRLSGDERNGGPKLRNRYLPPRTDTTRAAQGRHRCTKSAVRRRASPQSPPAAQLPTHHAPSLPHQQEDHRYRCSAAAPHAQGQPSFDRNLRGSFHAASKS